MHWSVVNAAYIQAGRTGCSLLCALKEVAESIESYIQCLPSQVYAQNDV